MYAVYVSLRFDTVQMHRRLSFKSKFESFRKRLEFSSKVFKSVKMIFQILFLFVTCLDKGRASARSE